MERKTYLLNTQQYKVRIKGKVEQSREKRCSSCWKGGLRVAFDDGCRLYLLIYIYYKHKLDQKGKT